MDEAKKFYRILFYCAVAGLGLFFLLRKNRPQPRGVRLTCCNAVHVPDTYSRRHPVSSTVPRKRRVFKASFLTIILFSCSSDEELHKDPPLSQLLCSIHSLLKCLHHNSFLLASTFRLMMTTNMAYITFSICFTGVLGQRIFAVVGTDSVQDWSRRSGPPSTRPLWAVHSRLARSGLFQRCSSRVFVSTSRLLPRA